VYDYVPGKAAWFAAGLPLEGTIGPGDRAGSVARRDVPTCSLRDPVGELRDRAEGWPMVVVVEHGVVLGVVRSEALGLDPTTPAEEVMRPGPSTFRPGITCTELAGYLDDHDTPRALITTLDGVLIGLAEKDDVDACAKRSGDE